MKILIQQLARLGDIYISWPAVRALRRQYPDAEIHFLTRPRFEGAVQGLTAIDRHISLPSGSILEPLVQENPDIDGALAKLESFIAPLKAENYDWIINLTFSPFSSYLTHALSTANTKVSGYSRFDDGYFRPSDEMSSYFYAQVGIGKANRVHLADIFASMLNLEYIEADWATAEGITSDIQLPEGYMVVHVGASERQKSLSSFTWASALNAIAAERPGTAVALIGANSEVIQAQEIIDQCKDLRFFNYVGKTQISDLFAIIQKADLLLGCDSAPIHVASLTDTPTLNISVGSVNFWETGPKASLAFILRAEQETAQLGEKIGSVVNQLLSGVVDQDLIVRSSGLASYAKEDETAAEAFQWNLVQAIYLGMPHPMADRVEIVQAALKLNEVNSFIMDQIALIPSVGLERVAPLIEQGEEIIKTVSRIVPEMSPLINWYHAEKVRIAPGSQEEIRSATLQVHQAFAQQLQVYIPQEEVQIEEAKDGTL